MDQRLTRRAFVIHVGAAAALLGRVVPSAAQTSAAPVAGKDKLIVRSPRPINLETPLKDLGADITPTDLFFVRNNYDGPEIDASQYVLKVDGEVGSSPTSRSTSANDGGDAVHASTVERTAGQKVAPASSVGR